MNKRNKYPVEIRCCLDGCGQLTPGGGRGGRKIARVKRARGGDVVLERLERYPQRSATLTAEEKQALTGEGDLVDLVRRKGGRWEIVADTLEKWGEHIHTSKVRDGWTFWLTCERHGDIAVAGRWLLEAFGDHEQSRRRVTLTIT